MSGEGLFFGSFSHFELERSFLFSNLVPIIRTQTQILRIRIEEEFKSLKSLTAR
jgi:hypothetical protein